MLILQLPQRYNTAYDEMGTWGCMTEEKLGGHYIGEKYAGNNPPDCSLAKIDFGFAPLIDFAGFSQKVGVLLNY
jgi:hypothetical protein